MEGAGDDIRSITRPHTPKLMGRTQASWFWFFLFFLSFFHLRTDTDGYYWRIEWESSPFADVVRQRSYDGQLKRKWKPWAVNESTKWGCVTSRVTWGWGSNTHTHTHMHTHTHTHTRTHALGKKPSNWSRVLNKSPCNLTRFQVANRVTRPWIDEEPGRAMR